MPSGVRKRFLSKRQLRGLRPGGAPWVWSLEGVRRYWESKEKTCQEYPRGRTGDFDEVE